MALVDDDNDTVSATVRTGKFILDPREFELGSDGVAQFADPVPRENIVAFRDVLLPLIAAFGRSFDSALDRDTVACCTGRLAIYAMHCFRASSLVRRCAEAGQKFQPPPKDFLFAFLNGSPDHVEAADSALRCGSPPRTNWKAPARSLRNTFRGGNIVEREFLPIDLGREIVTTAMWPLHQKHAGASDRKVVYCHPGRWLKPVDYGIEEPGLENIVHGLIQCVREAYEICDEIFDENAHTQIRYWTEAFPRTIQDHLRNLEKMKLPCRLWIGSASPVLYRMLVHAVRAAGGDVTSHDHGTSVGFFTRNVKAVNELEGVDRFLTMTADNAEGLRRSLRSDILVRTDIPEIGVVPGDRLLPAPGVLTRSGKQKDGMKIMLVTNVYSGSRVWMYPHESDAVILDWQARLIAWLERQGHKVLLKPHPECAFGPPGQLVDLGVNRVLSDAFGTVYGEADILLYDYPMTTTFAEGLASERPIVFVNFELEEFDQKASKLLNRRCAVVRGRKDSIGRRQIDWDELGKAFGRAPELRDTGFFDTYLAY